ncbi:hypothetical protein J3F84DRAFT_352047 [Trichoderma pleuroticola]
MASTAQGYGIYVDELTIERLHAKTSRIVDLAGNRWHENSPIRTFMKDVQDVTERVMTCPRDWVTICSQLDELYGDAQQTIDAVTEAIVAWCKAIISLVTDKSG